MRTPPRTAFDGDFNPALFGMSKLNSNGYTTRIYQPVHASSDV